MRDSRDDNRSGMRGGFGGPGRFPNRFPSRGGRGGMLPFNQRGKIFISHWNIQKKILID